MCPGGNANPSTASENRTTTLSAVISADFTFTSALMIADATSFRTSGVRHALGNLCADNDDDELHGCQYATTKTTTTTNANYIVCSHDARRSHRARAHAPRDVNERHVCARRKLTPNAVTTAFTASARDDPRERDRTRIRVRTQRYSCVRSRRRARERRARRRTDGTRTDAAVGVAAAARLVSLTRRNED